ncbi:GNAT family N-acetyltransferase [Feifania hominis]|uniref:GNAT family N-acetyltransferase n=1 Tax=Feifania hominis TaxID=2763660 RepID=UPI002015F699
MTRGVKLCYRGLGADEICRELFYGFVRRQVVTDCWRREEGRWVIREDGFVDDWAEEDYRELITSLKSTAARSGLVYACFCDGALKGFVSVEPERFGARREYLDLTNLHVSEDMRGRGIGTVLFRAARQWARREGASKLYLSAHSAVETQAFYRARGCVEAREYSREHVEREPFDCQLECSCEP